MIDHAKLTELLTARLKTWWGPNEDVAASVAELLEDIGAATVDEGEEGPHRAKRGRDRTAHRAYMREYMQRRRAAVAADPASGTAGDQRTLAQRVAYLAKRDSGVAAS